MDASQLSLAAVASHPDWWSGWMGALLGAAIGAVLGSCIPLVWTSRQRRLERIGELVGMQVELRLQQMDMDALLNDPVQSPLYRLPVSIFERALPKLIGEKKLTVNEISLLVEYVNRVDELNRGLDRAAEASTTTANGWVVEGEYNRNRDKAKKMLSEKLARHADQSLFAGAWAALLRLENARSNRFWRWICRRWQYGAFAPP
jgi:hypothetical protein